MSVAASTFSWKIPGHYHGARMYPILPDKSAADIIGMAQTIDQHQQILGECGWLGIVPCEWHQHGEACPTGVATKHSHFVHWGDSGTANLAAPISSQPFFDFALSKMPELGRGFYFPTSCISVFGKLLADESSKLARAMTKDERPFIEGDKFVTYVTNRLSWSGC